MVVSEEHGGWVCDEFDALIHPIDHGRQAVRETWRVIGDRPAKVCVSNGQRVTQAWPTVISWRSAVGR